MVVEQQTSFQLAQRRLAVRRFWRSEPEKRQKATTYGFAQTLGTSTTVVNEFENGHREDLSNGKTRADYVRLLERLENEVERKQRKAS